LTFCLIFSIFTPLTLLIGLFSLSPTVRGAPLSPSSVISFLNSTPPSLYAALPGQSGEVKGDFSSADARPVHIRQYLEKYNSPLIDYDNENPDVDLVGLIVELSEKYEVDFRLPLAIAQCESNICKRIPEGSYNCWGFENGATKFSSYEHAFERVFKTLKEGYIDQGLVTPEQIMPKYAPPSVAKGGPWAKCVSKFLKEME